MPRTGDRVDRAAAARLDVYLEYARALSGARSASYFGWDERARELVLRAATFLDGPPETPTRFPAGRGLAGSAVTTRRPTFCRDATRDPRFHRPPGPPPETASVLSLPLQEADGVRGVLNLTWPEARDRPPRDHLDHLEQAGTDLLRRLDPGSETLPPGKFLAPARALQRHGLPPADRIPGHRLAHVYRPLHDVGGDLLGAWSTSTRATLAVGDASGHDAGSAMLSAMARAILARGAREGRPLEALAAELDEAIECEAPVGWFLTHFLVRLIPTEDRLEFLGGGHPPALLQLPHQPGVLALDSVTAGAGMRGVGQPAGHAPWPRGATLLLYTDGLEELYGGLRARAALSERLAAARDLPVEELRATLLEDHERTWDVHADDVTALIIRRDA